METPSKPNSIDVEVGRRIRMRRALLGPTSRFEIGGTNFGHNLSPVEVQ